MAIKIVVTGANGQLGSELRQLAKATGEFEFVFTDLPELDILDFDSLDHFVKDKNIDYIINCAAYTAVDKAESDKELADKINALGPKNLALVAKKYDITLLHISTDFVFDGRKSTPYTEDDLTNPLSVYGETKLSGENRIKELLSDYYIIRTSWLYSAFGNNFVKTMIRLGREKDYLNVIFDQIGSPTYAADLATALIEIIRKDIKGANHYGTYHFSNEGVASWYDFTLAIHEMMGIECKVTPIRTEAYPTPAMRPHYSVMDKSKIKQNFGIDIRHWREALNEMVKTQ